ncbi:TPA: hypothetical protein I7718_20765, partial [Vibrio vulnificus]|nr:hypothetical protein [Vibrio vulnificus]
SDLFSPDQVMYLRGESLASTNTEDGIFDHSFTYLPPLPSLSTDEIRRKATKTTSKDKPAITKASFSVGNPKTELTTSKTPSIGHLKSISIQKF